MNVVKCAVSEKRLRSTAVDNWFTLYKINLPVPIMRHGKKNFVSNTSNSYFFKTKRFLICFFFNKILFQIKPFPPQKCFLNKKVLQYLGIKCYILVIFSKLFIRHLSRRIDRTKSAGKRAATGKSQTVINWKRINEERHLCPQTQ